MASIALKRPERNRCRSTHSRDGDSPILPNLLDQICSVTADGSYDTRRWHSALIVRDAVPIILIRRMVDCGRKTIRRHSSATKPCAPPDTMAALFGSAGRAIKPEVGAKRRWLPGLRRREHRRQNAEIHIRIVPMNRFSATCSAEIQRVA
jgi:hypothetical protein